MLQSHEFPTENVRSTTRLSNWLSALKSLCTIRGIAPADGSRRWACPPCSGPLPLWQNQVLSTCVRVN